MIFPQPKKEEYKNGFCNKTFASTNDLYEFYQEVKNSIADIVIDSGLGEEEYYLDVEADKITIRASSDCGVFRASSSLIQLADSNGKFPLCSVHDSPDFEKRAYMLDISRGRIPKKETVVFLIDLLAKLKYNELQLYMEGVVYKYSAFEELSAGLDCLTSGDIEFLDKYCSDRFISLVPNQNSFGHLADWLNRDEFRHLKVGPAENMHGEINPSATINPLLPESLEFMDKIYQSLFPYFSADVANVGFDEVFDIASYELEEVAKKYGESKIFMDWLSKITTLCQSKYGKKVQFWADMLMKYPDAYKSLPNGAIPLVWGYDPVSTARKEVQCKMLGDHGIEYYVCPGDNTWLALTGRFDVMTFNLRNMADFGMKYKAKGYMLTNWGNGGHPQFPAWTFIPLALAGQYAWNSMWEKPGWMLKTDFVRSAKKFTDREIFGEGVSEIIYRMQRYYRLEPELMHCCSLCGYSFSYPMDTDVVQSSFNLTECGDDFYFDNIISYMEKCLAELDKKSVSDKWKSQIVNNCHMVIIASELLKIRMSKKIDRNTYDRLYKLSCEITEEYQRLWDEENYSSGKELFINQLTSRIEETKCFIIN